MEKNQFSSIRFLLGFNLIWKSKISTNVLPEELVLTPSFYLGFDHWCDYVEFNLLEDLGMILHILLRGFLGRKKLTLPRCGLPPHHVLL